MSPDVASTLISSTLAFAGIVFGIIWTRGKPGITTAPPTSPPSTPPLDNGGTWVNIGATLESLSKAVARLSAESADHRERAEWWETRAGQLEHWGTWDPSPVPRPLPAPFTPEPGGTPS